MSDRIEELVLDGCAFVACPRPQDCDTCPLTELATIARAAEWIDRCYRSEERALKAEAMCEWLAERLEALVDAALSVDTWLTAAREAVTHER